MFILPNKYETDGRLETEKRLMAPKFYMESALIRLR